MKKNYILEDLDCANCAAKIEEGVKKIEGVTECSVSFVTEKMIVEIEDGKEKEIEKEIKKNYCSSYHFFNSCFDRKNKFY